MKKRFLGNTGIEVSEIAFGGVEIGMPYGIGVDDILPEKDAIELLHAAVDKGTNFFDTARAYGLSEERMGKAFSQMRDKVVIGSKCKHIRAQDGSLPAVSTLGNIIRTSIEESLEALQTDYIDLYMLHYGDMEILKIEEVADEMLKLKQSGKVRAIGVSVYTVEESKAAIESGIWNTVQVPFNLMDQTQHALFSLAEKNGVGIVVRSVLMKGLLSTRGTGLHPELAPVEKHISSYHQLLNDGCKTLPELAVKFALSFPQVSSVLVGIDKMDYLQQSLLAANGDYLSGERLRHAQELAYPDPAFLNLHHWHVKGWLV